MTEPTADPRSPSPKSEAASLRPRSAPMRERRHSRGVMPLQSENAFVNLEGFA